MDIPLDAKVYCTDGECGRSTCLIINPVSRQVTHLVVEEKAAPHTEHVMPGKLIGETAFDKVALSCSRDKFEAMKPFVETEHIREELPDYEHPAGDYWL